MVGQQNAGPQNIFNLPWIGTSTASLVCIGLRSDVKEKLIKPRKAEVARSPNPPVVDPEFTPSLWPPNPVVVNPIYAAVSWTPDPPIIDPKLTRHFGAINEPIVDPKFTVMGHALNLSANEGKS